MIAISFGLILCNLRVVIESTFVSPPKARAVAFHLPQFHPIPENNEWWGAGFTEWTNVVRARRRYPGHYQPHVPADLGFYDLRLPEALWAQASLAKAYGLEGFVFWHYWFAGRRLLERPVDLWRSQEGPPFGFALAWANQTWTGHWHGAERRVLVSQEYPGESDFRRHFEAVLPAFIDSRYLRVDGRPMFYVFRGEDLPNPRQFVDIWQRLAREAGLPGLFLIAEVSDPLGRSTYGDPFADGFDAGVDLQLPARRTRASTLAMKMGRKLGLPEIYRYSGDPLDRSTFQPERPVYPAVVPNWDNTPRSGSRGLVLHGSTPDRFRAHVRDAVSRLAAAEPGRRLLFVKSWNEWAEGNHLEPDLRHGTTYLEVLRDEVVADDQPERAGDESRRSMRST